MIKAVGFEKWFGDFAAVSGLNIDVPRGAIVALVGPNGAGKTTTIRSLCGILRPTRGTLFVDGYRVDTQLLDVKKRTAYVPDDPPLFDSLTVWEHFSFIGQAYSLTNWEDDANALLAMFALSEKAKAFAGELSRGMRQKLALACAYLRQPTVLLLDEPMTGLDPTSIRVLKESFLKQAAKGTTLLISSHLLDIVGDLCNHLILMQKGKALFDGPMADALQQFGGTNAKLEEVFFHFADGESIPQ